MAVIDKVMVEVLNIAVRGLDGTQTTTPIAPTLVKSSTTSATPTPTNNGGGGGGNTSQSPLLFFVALGFGVVFTNLWIIVGVKYCFRYNARNRALARGEDGEPINLENMPRPHRRRREKKLMTMDEVNERFPITKYKNWVMARANEGLPTAGGVTAPSSRAASLVNVEGAMPPSPVTSKHSEDRPMTAVSTGGSPEITASSATTNGLADKVGEQDRKSTDVRTSIEGVDKTSEEKNVQGMPTLTEVNTAATIDANKAGDEDEDDDDDHIHGALPPELIANPGDSCAICIDTLEQDDDIRGLTCGHAFHAGCLDPWLTSRRACCPLCKADYFVPKPRPEGEAAETERPRRGPMGRMNLPAQPRSAWIGLRGTRGILPGRFMAESSSSPVPANESHAQRQRRERRTQRRELAATRAATTVTLEPQEVTGATANTTGGEDSTSASRSRLQNPFHTSWMPSMRLSGWRRGNNSASNTAEEPTPAQLESGVIR